MDLSEIKSGERTIEILHPGNKQPIGVRVGIVAIDDDRLAKLKRNINDEQLRLQQRGKFLKTEEIEDNMQQLMFAAMTGWTWYNPTGKPGDKDYDAEAMPDFNGEVPEFNRKNVKAITTDLKWFGEQLKEGIGDTDAFFSDIQFELERAIKVYVRYELPNENGQTRRERYLEMEEVAEAPPLIVPDAGRYIWDWFDSLRGSIRRVRDDVCEPYPPSEFLAWAEMSGAIVRTREWSILRAMDAAYCEAMNAEVADFRARQADQGGKG